MGRNVTNQDFVSNYQNLFDANLGNNAPSDMYIAKTLGLNTLVYYPRVSNVIPLTFDLDQHLGSWQFKIRSCVDRIDDLYNALDCDPGQNNFRLEFETAPEVCQWT